MNFSRARSGDKVSCLEEKLLHRDQGSGLKPRPFHHVDDPVLGDEVTTGINEGAIQAEFLQNVRSGMIAVRHHHRSPSLAAPLHLHDRCRRNAVADHEGDASWCLDLGSIEINSNDAACTEGSQEVR
jgi:hypothetical protein